ncbi:MAG: hypothetical protein ACXVP7_01805 [Actinomycetota bacterium]
MAPMSSLPPAAASSRGRDVHTGRLLLGLALAALGVLWLLQALDVATIDWNVGLPIAVIAIGVALLIAGFMGRGSGGLVVLGIALTVLLLASTVVDVPLGGGAGNRTYRPTMLESRTYELAMGEMTIDLRHPAIRSATPRTVHIAGHVGVGHLVVIVPSTYTAIDVHAKAGIGDVLVFGHDRSGFGPEYRSAGTSEITPSLVLDVTVGIGQVEVRRG